MKWSLVDDTNQGRNRPLRQLWREDWIALWMSVRADLILQFSWKDSLHIGIFEAIEFSHNSYCHEVYAVIGIWGSFIYPWMLINDLQRNNVTGYLLCSTLYGLCQHPT